MTRAEGEIHRTKAQMNNAHRERESIGCTSCFWQPRVQKSGETEGRQFTHATHPSVRHKAEKLTARPSVRSPRRLLLSDFRVDIVKTSSDARESGCSLSKRVLWLIEREKKRGPTSSTPDRRSGARLKVLRKAAAWRGEQDSAERSGMALI